MLSKAATTATRTGGTRTLLRTMILAAGVVLLAWSLAQRDAGATEIDPTALGTMQTLACEGNGGTALVEVHRDGTGVHLVEVTCTGGYSDGVKCTNTPEGGFCYRLARPDEDSRVAPTGGIEEGDTDGGSGPMLQVEGQVVGTIDEQP